MLPIVKYALIPLLSCLGLAGVCLPYHAARAADVDPAKSPAAIADPSATAATANAEDDDADDDDDETVDSGEGESRDACPAVDPGIVYSKDISTADLAKRFVTDIASLGSISVGFADEGSLINGVQMPTKPNDAWVVATPDYAWGTQEAIDAVIAAAQSLHESFPRAAPLRVSRIGLKEGGYLRPHKSHQSGRDVDLGFFYDDNVTSVNLRDRRPIMDAALNWALLRELVTRADVQVVLVDHKISAFLHDYALSIGEDPSWLSSLFGGQHPLIQHARRHRDHFHVRFFAPRSQELGRRIQPLLAKRADTNMAFHKVRSGDTLGHIAARYNSSIEAIKRANHMKNSFLSLARTLVVPMRGPCTHCPMPPPVVVPAKRLPPPEQSASADTVVATEAQS